MIAKNNTSDMSLSNHSILFVCQANSVRSQMARALMRSMVGDDVEVLSAGFTPAGLDRRVIRVMEEIDIDASLQQSKGFDMVPIEKVDLVIDLRQKGKRGDLPTALQSVEYKHWPTPDPYAAPPSGGDGLAYFRSVRDELKKRIKQLVSEE
jgi:arsenate reductase